MTEEEFNGNELRLCEIDLRLLQINDEASRRRGLGYDHKMKHLWDEAQALGVERQRLIEHPQNLIANALETWIWRAEQTKLLRLHMNSVQNGLFMVWFLAQNAPTRVRTVVGTYTHETATILRVAP